MENNKKVETNQQAKAPLADDKHKLDGNISERGKEENNLPGKLPNDNLDTDHNSDPVLAKNQ